MTSLPTSALLSTEPGARPAPLLLEGGVAAFERILERIEAARRSILVRAFVWRQDPTGEMVARALLRAADRGVEVTIQKDRIGAHYEYLEESRRSLFHKQIDPVMRLQIRFMRAAYRMPGSPTQQPSDLADALARHGKVRIERDRKRFDHAKVYVFDDEAIVLGGIGIGDDYRRKNVDFMVELRGEDVVRRFHDRCAGRTSFDPGREVDFLVHSLAVSGPRGSPLLTDRLALIAAARKRLTVAMAYLGDPRCTDALVDAVGRGVRVTLLTAERSDILGDLTLGTCEKLLRRTGAPDHLRVVLHPRMIHAKAMVTDGRVAEVGSANFTRLSHGVYDEVDVCCRNDAFACALEAAIEREAYQGRRLELPVRFSRPQYWIESAVIRYQSRRRSG